MPASLTRTSYPRQFPQRTQVAFFMISSQQMHISGIAITLQRKPIKNLYLRVSPPDGIVSLSAPLAVEESLLQTFVSKRLAWIKKQQAHCRALPPRPAGQLISGEFLDLFGTSYRLEVVERYGRHNVIIDNNTAYLFISPGTTPKNRLKVVREWYRTELKQRIQVHLDHWQPILKVKVREWGVRRMKTRWGSCNLGHKRIWLSLHLATRPPDCLEYVVVHELVHLLERYHNKHFYGLLDQFLPDWQARRSLLNTAFPSYEKN